MNGEYTRIMESKIEEFVQRELRAQLELSEMLNQKKKEAQARERPEDISKIVAEYFYQTKDFRTFGDGLKDVIQKKMPKGDERDTITYLKDRVKETGISIPDSTIADWFKKDSRPRKGVKSRETMYRLCFLLELSYEETEEFFRKVYYDRPFNLRDVKEFIYCYCFLRGYDYRHATELIKAAEVSEYATDETIHSLRLRSDIVVLEEDEEVLTYIQKHSHNFYKNSENAKAVLNMLLEQVLMTEEEKEKLENGITEGHCSYIAKECAIHPEYLDSKSNWTSKSFMLKVIEQISFDDIRKKYIVVDGERKNIQTEKLPPEIFSRFPRKQTLLDIEKSEGKIIFEEIRKMIILLFSYIFWFQKEYEEQYDWDLELYISQLNEILYQACLQELYFGNPYDWLFMYCTVSEEPLEVFRNLLAELVLSSQ